jgi:hypothetical protein
MASAVEGRRRKQRKRPPAAALAAQDEARTGRKTSRRRALGGDDRHEGISCLADLAVEIVRRAASAGCVNAMRLASDTVHLLFAGWIKVVH